MSNRFSSLVRMLRDARREWSVIAHPIDGSKKETAGRITLELVLPVALWLGATATFDGWHNYVDRSRLVWTFGAFFLMPFVAITIPALIANILAPGFGGRRSLSRAWILMSYALAPSLIFFGLSHLLGAFFPVVAGLVVFIFALFVGIGMAAYILWDGLALLFHVPDRRLGWLLVLTSIFASITIIGLSFTANTLFLDGVANV